VDLTRDLRSQGFRIVLLDHAPATDKDADALHDVNRGKPCATVFVADILGNHGTWTKGANSVSCAVSHEVVELLADPVCLYYVDGLDGYMYAFEIADPTEADSYEIGGVAVSNFVYPEYWNPWAKKGTRLDHMRRIGKPFEVRAGGYQVRYRGNVEHTIWGPAFPKWRKDAKKANAARRMRIRRRRLRARPSR
jgi:hypothetical protein